MSRVLDSVGVVLHGNNYPGNFFSGEEQRVEMTRA
jgi:ABC-type ATPase involved in cell division